MPKRRLRRKSRVRRSSRASYSRAERKVPLGIKVISILGLIGAIITFIFGLVILVAGIVGGTFASQILESLGNSSGNAVVASVLVSSLMLGGILIVLWAVVEFLIARGLWRGRNWARIITGIFAIVWFVSSLLNLNFLGVVIAGLIGYYLWFSKEAKAYYSR